MRSILFFLFGCICLYACSSEGEGYKIKNTSRVEIYYNDGDSVYKFIDTLPTEQTINAFIQVLNGKSMQRIYYSGTGEIGFYSKDSLLFESAFLISGEKHQYLMNGERAWKLTYNSGMYLSAIIAGLKNNNAKHH